jgi:uncharacterized membrane protein HdeD (DUF308 family)
MYHDRSGDWGFGSAIAICLVIGLLGAFAFVKAVSLIIHAFVRYPGKRILWGFLGGFVASLVLGALLGYVFQTGAFLNIGLVGFLALTLVCYIVELRNSQTFLKTPESIVQQVLHTNWFGDGQDAKAA